MHTLTKVDNLVPRKRYCIDVWWNLSNNVRYCEPYQFMGEFVQTNHIAAKKHTNSNGLVTEFVQTNHIPAKKHTNSNGLVTLLAPARTEVLFRCIDHYGHRENEYIRVSSINQFHSSYRPKSIELCHRQAIMKLRLPTDIKRYLRSFMETRHKHTRKSLQIEKIKTQNTTRTHHSRSKHT